MKKRAAFFFFSFLFLAGCLGEDPEELARLTREDPGFKEMIVSRDKARAEIASIQSDLLSKKNALDTQMERLRAEYDTVATAQNERISTLRTAVDTNRGILRRKIDPAEAELEKKKAGLELTQKKLANARKILNQSRTYNMNKTEKKTWQERVLLLSEKIGPYEEAIQDLKLQIRLCKRKIHYLNT